MISINEIFYDAVISAANGTQCVFPNVDIIPDVEYYKIDCLLSNKFGVGVSELDRQNGFCQISSFIRDGTGEIKAITMAQKMIDAFPRNTRLSGGGLIVRIDSPPYYSNGMNTGNGWFMIPVTIPFTVLT